MDIEVKNLHPLEVRLLRHVSPGEAITADRLVSELGYKIGQCNQAFSWLTAKGLLSESSREKYTLYELTDTGRAQAVAVAVAFRLRVVHHGAHFDTVSQVGVDRHTSAVTLHRVVFVEALLIGAVE